MTHKYNPVLLEEKILSNLVDYNNVKVETSGGITFITITGLVKGYESEKDTQAYGVRSYLNWLMKVEK